MKATTELWKAANAVRVIHGLPEASSAAAAEVQCKDCSTSNRRWREQGPVPRGGDPVGTHLPQPAAEVKG